MSKFKDTILGDRLYSSSDTYPDAPGWRREGPSKDAAKRVASKAKSIRDRIRDVFAAEPYGLTTDEAAHRLGIEPWRIRPRVAELHAAGDLIETPDRRKGDSGLWVTVWKTAPKTEGL